MSNYKSQECARILVFGDIAVGKSTIIQYLVNLYQKMDFVEASGDVSSIAGSTCTICEVLGSFLEIIEIQQLKHHLSRSCLYKHCHGIILVHHVMHYSTYTYLYSRLRDFQQYNQNHIPVLIIGTHQSTLDQQRCTLAELTNGYSITLDLVPNSTINPLIKFKDIISSFVNQSIQCSISIQ